MTGDATALGIDTEALFGQRAIPVTYREPYDRKRHSVPSTGPVTWPRAPRPALTVIGPKAIPVSVSIAATVARLLGINGGASRGFPGRNRGIGPASSQ